MSRWRSTPTAHAAAIPGPGGWAALLIAGTERKEDVAARRPTTTNNRMELMAAIERLGALKRRCAVKLYTDSKYVLQGVTEWLPGWKARGWRTAAREPVKNQDLWEQLDARRGGAGHRVALGARAIRAMTATSIVDPARQSRDRPAAGGRLDRCVKSCWIRRPPGWRWSAQHRVIEIGCVELCNRRADGASLSPLLESGARHRRGCASRFTA